MSTSPTMSDMPVGPATNGSVNAPPVEGVVVVREADYRRLVAEQKKLLEHIQELETKYQVLRDCYASVRRTLLETLQDKLPPDDPTWLPASVEELASLEDLPTVLGGHVSMGGR